MAERGEEQNGELTALYKFYVVRANRFILCDWGPTYKIGVFSPAPFVPIVSQSESS